MPVSPLEARVWSLVGLLQGQDRISTIELTPLPFRIGRRPALHLTLAAESVSTEHAEFYADGDNLRLRDLGSTNGTFLNRIRIQDSPVREGDVVHFADNQFQIVSSAVMRPRPTAVFQGLPSPQPLLSDMVQLQELLKTEAVAVVFQPIVALPDRGIVGFEALGRGRHPGLPESPGELFRTAAALGVEVELSRLFRKKVVETVRSRTDLLFVFVNTHPAELSLPGLVDSLGEMSRVAPHVEFTVEIHEAAIVKVTEVVAMKAALRTHGIRLAYDDFGAGQARLLELGEAPPDLLKFDIRFIRGIDKASESKRRVLKSLVGMVRELGAEPLAEGVESAEEAAACIDLGFTRAQGYYFGRPATM